MNVVCLDQIAPVFSLNHVDGVSCMIIRMESLITSAKDILFLVQFVCLFVRKIMEKNYQLVLMKFKGSVEHSQG